MLEAVTFDFWDTLFIDDSDEPARAERGLLTKPQARAAWVVGALQEARPGLTRLEIEGAWDQANRWCDRSWKERRYTPTVAERLDRALELLSLPRPPGFGEVVERIEGMEVEIPPLPAPGVPEMLAALSGRYRIGIISDTIVSPGRSLRRILEGAGLYGFFDPKGLIFSDEVGVAKPDPEIFLRAAGALGVAPGALLHVGDRESNDVEGPRAAGCRAVLYAGVRDRGGPPTRADARCLHHRDLPGILQELR